MIVTITRKAIKKKVATLEDAIQFINSFVGKTRRPTKRAAADASRACANFQKARDGKCYNCGFDVKSHRRTGNLVPPAGVNYCFACGRELLSDGSCPNDAE